MKKVYRAIVYFRLALTRKLKRAKRDPASMSMMDHLTELRVRLIVSIIAFIIGAIVAFIYNDWVFTLVMRPLTVVKGGDAQLATFSPTEPFLTVMTVSIYAGLILASPVILYEFWAFVMPALYERERKSVIPYAFLTFVLFLVGVAFGYYLVLPVGLTFLLGYGGDMFNQQLRASEYLSFVSMLILGFGVFFEIPIFVLLLSSLGIVNTKRLRKSRKYALVIIAVVSAMVTPPDPLSMLMMMAPLLLLYELGIGLGRIAERRRERRLAEEASSAAGETA